MGRKFIFTALILLLPIRMAGAVDQLIRIGVLSHRGVEATLKNWSPTADYLSLTVPGHRFEVVPLGFAEVDPAVRFGR